MTPTAALAGAVIGQLAPSQVIVDGVVNGLIYGLVGMGVVLVYRSTRVINFAVGAMGLPAAALVALLSIQYGIPYVPSLVVGLAAGTLFGAVVELIVVRRLFTAPRVILLVATIGVAQVAQAIAMSLPEIDDVSAAFPLPFSSSLHLGDVVLRPADVLTVITVPVMAVALGWLMSRTPFGRKVAASADNPDLARLSGVSPKVVSTIVWTIAGLLASISLVLIAGRVGNVTKVATLGPATLSRGLIVAVLAGLISFPRSVIAGVAVGVVEAVIGFHTLDQPGTIDMLLLLTVLVAVWFQSRRSSETERAVFAFAPDPARSPNRSRTGGGCATTAGSCSSSHSAWPSWYRSPSPPRRACTSTPGSCASPWPRCRCRS